MSEPRPRHGSSLLDKLRKNIRDGGHALMMDLGHGGGTEPFEVWNHAVYQYTIRYWQPKVADPRFTEGELKLFANADLPPGKDGWSTGFPGEPTTMDGQQVVYSDGLNGRNQTARFALRFTTGGAYDPRAPDNVWRDVQLDSQLIYAPRNAARILTPLDVQGMDPFRGNVFLEREDVLALIALREKYE